MQRIRVTPEFLNDTAARLESAAAELELLAEQGWRSYQRLLDSGETSTELQMMEGECSQSRTRGRELVAEASRLAGLSRTIADLFIRADQEPLRFVQLTAFRNVVTSTGGLPVTSLPSSAGYRAVQPFNANPQGIQAASGSGLQAVVQPNTKNTNKKGSGNG
jgi:hypothetical protein